MTFNRICEFNSIYEDHIVSLKVFINLAVFVSCIFLKIIFVSLTVFMNLAVFVSLTVFVKIFVSLTVFMCLAVFMSLAVFVKFIFVGLTVY